MATATLSIDFEKINLKKKESKPGDGAAHKLKRKTVKILILLDWILTVLCWLDEN